MEGLPTEILAKIVGYLHAQERLNVILSYRTINKRFNRGVIAARQIWTGMMDGENAKKIGPNSVHDTANYGRRRCRYNRQGKCHVYGHYKYNTLVPKYGEDDAYNAYKAVIKRKRDKRWRQAKAYERKMEFKLREAMYKYRQAKEDHEQAKAALTKFPQRKRRKKKDE